MCPVQGVTDVPVHSLPLAAFAVVFVCQKIRVGVAGRTRDCYETRLRTQKSELLTRSRLHGINQHSCELVIGLPKTDKTRRSEKIQARETINIWTSRTIRFTLQR